MYLTKYSLSDQINKDEMGGACSTYGIQGEMHTRVRRGNLRERDHLEDLGVDGTIILSSAFKKLDADAWTGLIRLRRLRGGGLL